ncbi:hypothetical protein CEXT_391151 [Caerostris extrusa]|uniref:Uncharacterized protein n=1 Tax=Caerostris extrusa TaxID=172846 RepID=A0AAV4Y2N2_CAEEX|nr:hypothetical protein CEXT_391151 [Caerostris extrusa]
MPAKMIARTYDKNYPQKDELCRFTGSDSDLLLKRQSQCPEKHQLIITLGNYIEPSFLVDEKCSIGVTYESMDKTKRVRIAVIAFSLKKSCRKDD